MDLGIDGKVALITASSRGLGLGCAEALARDGAHVVICAKDAHWLAEVQSRLKQLERGRVEAVAANIHKEEDRARLLDAARAISGGVDILVANTPGGVGAFKPVSDLSTEEWEHAINCKFRTALELSRGVLPEMLSRRWGRIISISTISAWEPLRDWSLSNATRLASIGLLRTLALEAGPENVTANTLLVGYTETRTLRDYFVKVAEQQSKSPAQVEREIVDQTPIRRLLTIEEVGSFVAFLCSDAAGAITGQTLRIDGGFSRAL